MDIQISQASYQAGRFHFEIDSLQIKHPSQILLTGPSGCGKSTFLNMLMGLIPLMSGDVHYGQYSQKKMSAIEFTDFRKRNMNFVFQKLHLVPFLNVYENLKLISHHDQDIDLEIKNHLIDFHLSESQFLYPQQISVGESQKIAIIRSILNKNTPYYFADEPTSSLDDKNAHLVIQKIKNHIHNKTALIISHDYRLIQEFKDVIPFNEVARVARR